MDDAAFPVNTNPLSEQALSHPLAPADPRRLCDKVLIVFHCACDALDLQTAASLLHLLEFMTINGSDHGMPDRRLDLRYLVDAHERLLALSGSFPLHEG